MPALKKESAQVNNLTLHIKELEKEEQTKLQVDRRKGIKKIKADINETETKKTTEKINETNGYFLEIKKGRKEEKRKDSDK